MCGFKRRISGEERKIRSDSYRHIRSFHVRISKEQELASREELKPEEERVVDIEYGFANYFLAFSLLYIFPVGIH